MLDGFDMDPFGGGVDAVRALLPWGARGNLIEAGSPALLTQDHLGATPVTAVGQKAGRLLSRWGGDYHQTQSLDAAKPIWGRHPRSGLRNLLQQTNNLTVAPWIASNLSVAAAGTLGGQPAFSLTDANAGSYANIAQALSGISGQCALSMAIAKTVGAATAFAARLNYNDGAARAIGFALNTNTGTWVSPSYWADGGAVRSVVDGGDHWLATVSGTVPAGATALSMSLFPAHLTTAGGDSPANTGAHVVAAPQLERGSVRTAYQVVGAAHDITEAGQADVWGVLYDGTDDFLASASTNWSTDVVTLITAVRKMSDTSIGMLSEFSPSTDNNAGTFFLAAPRDPNTANYGFRSAGTVISQANSAAAYAAPRCDIIVAQGKIGSDLCSIAINGGTPVTVTADQGSGGFGTYVLYSGARAGTSLFAKVADEGSVIINRALSAAEISRAGRYLAAMTGGTYA